MKKNAAKKNVKYSTKLHLSIIKNMIESGKSDKDIITALNIGRSTYLSWKKKPEIATIYEENEAYHQAKYDPKTHVPAVEYFKIIRKTDEEIADHFNIHVSTLYRWIQTYPEFSDAYTQTKLIANAAALKELRDRGINTRISKKETETFTYYYEKDETTGEYIRTERLTQKVVVKEDVLPDINALKFFIQHNDSEHFTEKGRSKEDDEKDNRQKALTPYEEKAIAILEKQDVATLRMLDDIFESLTPEEKNNYLIKKDMSRIIELIVEKLEEINAE